MVVTDERENEQVKALGFTLIYACIQRLNRYGERWNVIVANLKKKLSILNLLLLTIFD